MVFRSFSGIAATTSAFSQCSPHDVSGLHNCTEQKTEKWQDQYRFRCADNTYKYVLDRGFLLKDENGKAIRMIGAIQDITKQKEEEQS